MRLCDLNIDPTSGSVRISAVVERESGAGVNPYIEYKVEPEYIGDAAGAFASALLLPAMRAGEDLHVGPRVSKRLCVMLPRIRDIFHTWWPHLSRVDIDVTPEDALPSAPSLRAATFFSGGVDSFYSLLKHHRRHGGLPASMTHLIYMRGVETRLEDARKLEETENWIRDVAASTCGHSVIGESNVRTVLQGPEENLHWERHYHGSALAAIALGLSGGLGYVCIPSAFSYNHLVPHGSTPLVDEMYSTERIQVLHDGAEAPRPVKLARIIEWDRDLVLRYLRVCLMNRGGAHNCGRCKKCIRTAVPLRVLGVWAQASTFPNKSFDHWERVMAEDHAVLTEENLRFAQENGGDRALVALLTRVLRRKRRHAAMKSVISQPPLDRFLPVARRMAQWWYSRR